MAVIELLARLRSSTSSVESAVIVGGVAALQAGPVKRSVMLVVAPQRRTVRLVLVPLPLAGANRTTNGPAAELPAFEISAE